MLLLLLLCCTVNNEDDRDDDDMVLWYDSFMLKLFNNSSMFKSFNFDEFNPLSDGLIPFVSLVTLR